MKVQIVAILLTCCCSITSSKQYFKDKIKQEKIVSDQNMLFDEMWFEQRLDHEDATNLKTFKQRYFMSTAFYKSGGPVFISIGGEGPASAVWLKNGMWVNIAKETNALLVILEHRYYGQSHPTNNTCTDNLRYLSSHQAIEDLAHFIKKMSGLAEETPKVIVFGGSYSGSLALWARLRYPYLIDGAVGASGPLLAKADFYEFLEVVLDSLQTYGTPQCLQNIKVALQTTSDMLQSGKLHELKSIYSLCAELNPNGQDNSNFMQYVIGTTEGVVQYSLDNRDFEGGHGVSINDLCAIMDNATLGDMIERYAEAAKIVNNYGKCADVNYEDDVFNMRNVSWGSEVVSARLWIYQTCTEFGWYQTTDSKRIPWKYINMTFNYNYCKDVFGPDFTKVRLDTGIEQTNENYGALGIVNNIVKAVLFNGGVDPWHAVSYVQNHNFDPSKYGFINKGRSFSNNSSAFTSLFVPSSAHCAVLYPPRSDDDPLLVSARKTIHDLVKSWIA